MAGRVPARLSEDVQRPHLCAFGQFKGGTPAPSHLHPGGLLAQERLQQTGLRVADEAASGVQRRGLPPGPDGAALPSWQSAADALDPDTLSGSRHPDTHLRRPGIRPTKGHAPAAQAERRQRGAPRALVLADRAQPPVVRAISTRPAGDPPARGGAGVGGPAPGSWPLSALLATPPDPSSPPWPSRIRVSTAARPTNPAAPSRPLRHGVVQVQPQAVGSQSGPWPGYPPVGHAGGSHASGLVRSTPVSPDVVPSGCSRVVHLAVEAVELADQAGRPGWPVPRPALSRRLDGWALFGLAIECARQTRETTSRAAGSRSLASAPVSRRRSGRVLDDDGRRRPRAWPRAWARWASSGLRH